MDQTTKFKPKGYKLFKKYKTEKKVYYAVKHGFHIGIFEKWEDAKKQITGYPRPIYRKFDSLEDATIYMQNDNIINTNIQEILIQQDTYNETNDYDYKKWSKYVDNNIYIFTDGSKTSEKTGYGVYFGPDALNISVNCDGFSNNKCELIAIYTTLNIIWKFKNQLIALQNIETVDEDNIFNYDSPNEDGGDNLDNEKINSIVIISDSEYCINSLNKWVYDWSKNGWITKDNKEVAYQELFKPMLLMINKMKIHKLKVEFLHVNSHTPEPLGDKFKHFLWLGNSLADRLAKQL